LESAYAGFEPALPAFAWEGIEHRLNGRKRKVALLWWSAAAIVVATSITGIIYWNQHTSIPDTNSAFHKDQSSGEIQKQSTAPGNQGMNDATENTENPADLNSENKKDNRSQNSTSGNASNKPNPNTPVRIQNEDIIHPENLNPDLNEADANSGSYAATFNQLNGFGLRYENSEAMRAEIQIPASESHKLKLNITPPDRVMGARVMLGLGVGQIVSQTGFGVNPKYKNYVHEEFQKQMKNGEGILGAMSFSGSVGYRVISNHYLYTGINYYQRRNSINFDFDWRVPVTTSTGGEKPDLNGNYPIKSYFTFVNHTKFEGTNTYTEIDIPLGWYAQYKVGKKFTFIPSVSANIGFISIGSNNVTLGYKDLDAIAQPKSWYRSSIMLFNGSAGIYRDLNNKIKWGINANANYTATPLYDAGQTLRPRAFTGGLTTQIIWRLD